MEPREEGFDESDQQQILASKNKNIGEQFAATNSYFTVPEAKPILQKNYVDYDRAKVLIKEIQFTKQPIELLTSHISKDVLSLDKSHNAKHVPLLQNVQPTSIWNKYVLSQNYSLLYLKYFKDDVKELQSNGFKKFKLQLQKLCRNSQNLFSTYIVDFSFLSDVGTYLLRNLKKTNLEQLQNVPLAENQRIRFDSRFQSGNLFAVFENKTQTQKPITNTSIQQYQLILQSDVNSKGYSNWFYFSLQVRKKCTIRFKIINMQKIHSLFTKGMKAAFFSAQKLKKQNLGWHRDGYNYAYYRNQLTKNSDVSVAYNTLSFDYQVKYDNDLIFIAANLPYSYTKMINYVESVEKIAKLNPNIYFRKENIGKSISSNLCPMITLTWKRDPKKDKVRKKKKIIGVIARQHPSETVSSYVMQGLINSLVYLSDESSVQLLKNYIFKIVPMVNIDGVVYGNSRCDITGSDINRKWTRNPNKFMYPLISAIRNMFLKLTLQEYEIEYFIDLHGHSRKMGSFIYGCKTFDDIQSRQTAWIMSKINSKFIFEDSLFGLSALKRETARGSMSELVTNKKTMTLETSFYGYKTVTNRHFEVKDLHKMGATIIEALSAETTKNPKIINWETLRADIMEAITSARSNLNQNSDNACHMDQDSSFGSDSDPQEDQMNQKERGELFLDATVAAKIGLNEIKIVQKSKKNKGRQKIVQSQKYENIVDGLNDGVDIFQQKSTLLEAYHYSSQDVLKQKEKKFKIRQSRSVTKILPFKLSEKVDRSDSIARNQNFKTRKSVDTFLNLKQPQRLSRPQLPKVEKKNNFWSNLKKQYEGIIVERKLSLLNTRRK